MEELKHECGIAMVRLRKSADYYKQKYGSSTYGLDKMYLLMEKQRNRGQEGAGLACLKLDARIGEDFMFRERAEGSGAITEIFDAIRSQLDQFIGDIYMGHLRYSTTGRSGLSYVHPFLRRDNYRSRNLAVCGNFNLTNVDELFKMVTESGQHPRHYADTFLILEQLGHRLDREVERLYSEAIASGKQGQQISDYIERGVKIENVLGTAAPSWDGGYVICGITGSGESFMMRDPWGIRPAFYYVSDDVVVTASERPVIQTVMNVAQGDVVELQPGCALIVSKDGTYRISRILEAKTPAKCSFERIYFSRGCDADIYAERKALGVELVPKVLSSVDSDLDHSVFSFIPNTAEVAFVGLLQGLNQHLDKVKRELILSEKSLTYESLAKILDKRVRFEKVAIKDVKLRTFISDGTGRDDLAAHVYDITYGTLEAGVDNLVVIDDSIVRGTTLKQSVTRILSRLNPKKIVILSSAPQIRYPDFYGIDMSNLNSLIAFNAMVALIHDNNMVSELDSVYAKSKAQEDKPAAEMVNYVRDLYNLFTEEQISAKISELLTPSDIDVKVEIVFQNLEGLHKAVPNHTGDWYFSGKYPTPGGVRLLNRSFIDFYEHQ